MLNVIHITLLLCSRTTRKNTINLSNSLLALHYFLFHMESHFSGISEMNKQDSSLIVSSQVILTLRRNDCCVTLANSTKEDNNYACSDMKKQEDVFFLQFIDILSNRDVCMYSEMKRRVCRSLVVTDIGETLNILVIFKVTGVTGEKTAQHKASRVNLDDKRQHKIAS